MTEVSTAEIAGQPRTVRAARALIGWMPPDAAARVQVGNRADVPASAEIQARAQAARAVVAARPSGVDQSGVLGEAPPDLAAHIAALQAHPAGGP